MTVKIEVLDPQTESPSTLRALAHLFNVMAADRDGGKVAQLAPGTVPVGETPNVVLPNAGNAPAAPGASDQSKTGPSTDAPAGSSTLDWSVLDANGLPWNEKIHSSSKNQNADGTWRYLRGGDVAFRAEVEAEMRAIEAEATASKVGQGHGEQTPPPPPVAPNAADAPPPPPPVAPPAADAPPPPPPVTPPAAGSSSDEITMAMVFKRLSGLSKEDQTAVLTTVKLTAMGDFVKQSKEKPELIESLWWSIVAHTGEE